MRFAILPTLILAVSLTGCVGPSNDNVATYKKVGDRYLVEISGTRLAMVHDLKDLLPIKTYKDSVQYYLPRIEGKIDGKEIPPKKPGFFLHVGSITINGKKMTVSLSYDNYDYHRLDPVEWNGTYTLVEKK